MKRRFNTLIFLFLFLCQSSFVFNTAPLSIFSSPFFSFLFHLSSHFLFPHHPICFLSTDRYSWLSPHLFLSPFSLSSHPLLPASSGQSLRLVQSSSCCSVFLWLTDLLTLPKIRGNTGSALCSSFAPSAEKKILHSTPSINNTLPWEL